MLTASLTQGFFCKHPKKGSNVTLLVETLLYQGVFRNMRHLAVVSSSFFGYTYILSVSSFIWHSDQCHYSLLTTVVCSTRCTNQLHSFIQSFTKHPPKCSRRKQMGKRGQLTKVKIINIIFFFQRLFKRLQLQQIQFL